MQSTGGGGGTSVQFNVGYFMSILGILRCVELLFVIIVLATSATCHYGFCAASWKEGMGFVTFVGVVAMLGNLILIILRMLSILAEVAWMNLLEIIYSASCILLFFISLIISAVYATSIQFIQHDLYYGDWAACASFCFFTMVLYGVDLGFRLFIMRKG